MRRKRAVTRASFPGSTPSGASSRRRCSARPSGGRPSARAARGRAPARVWRSSTRPGTRAWSVWWRRKVKERVHRPVIAFAPGEPRLDQGVGTVGPRRAHPRRARRRGNDASGSAGKIRRSRDGGGYDAACGSLRRFSSRVRRRGRAADRSRRAPRRAAHGRRVGGGRIHAGDGARTARRRTVGRRISRTGLRRKLRRAREPHRRRAPPEAATARGERRAVDAIAFRYVDDEATLPRAQTRVELVYRVALDDYGGRSTCSSSASGSYRRPSGPEGSAPVVAAARSPSCRVLAFQPSDSSSRAVLHGNQPAPPFARRPRAARQRAQGVSLTTTQERTSRGSAARARGPGDLEHPDRAQELGRERARLEAVVGTLDRLQRRPEGGGRAARAGRSGRRRSTAARRSSATSAGSSATSSTSSSSACFRARWTRTTPSSTSRPAPAAPKRRTGRRCCCACICAGATSTASGPRSST